MVGWLHWLYQTIRFHPISSFSPSSSYGNNMPPTKSQAKPLNSPFPTESWNNHRSCPRNGATPCSVATKIRFLGDFALGAKKKTSIPDFEWMNQGIGKNKTSTQPGIASWRSEGSNISVPNGPVMFSLSPTFKLLKPAPGGRRLSPMEETPGCHGSWKSVYHQVWGGGTSADVNDPTIKIYSLVNQQKAIENCHL